MAGVTAVFGGAFVLDALTALGGTRAPGAGECDAKELAVRVVPGATAMPGVTVVTGVTSVLGGVVVADVTGVTGAAAADGAAALVGGTVALSEEVAHLGGRAASVVVLQSDRQVRLCTAAVPQNDSASFAHLRKPF